MKIGTIPLLAILFLVGCKKQDTPSSVEQLKLIVDVHALAGSAPERVEAILGKPNEISDSKYGKKYLYQGSAFEIMYISGKADWITINNLTDLPIKESSLSAIGLTPKSPTFSDNDSMRWSNYSEFIEVYLSGYSGKADYFHIKTFTK